jgi:hypothetical protein
LLHARLWNPRLLLYHPRHCHTHSSCSSCCIRRHLCRYPTHTKLLLLLLPGGDGSRCCRCCCLGLCCSLPRVLLLPWLQPKQLLHDAAHQVYYVLLPQLEAGRQQHHKFLAGVLGQ